MSVQRRLVLAAAIAVAVAALVFALERDATRLQPEAAPQIERHDPVMRTRRLSDEHARSRFAFVRRGTVARARPRRDARPVARLTEQTEDRTPELVLALEQTIGRGAKWVRIRLPARPNGSTGWVPRRALGRYHVVTTALRVNRRRLRAELVDRGQVVWRAPVAVGTTAAPTPPGRFYVRSRIIPRRPRGPYGVYAFGTNGFSPGASDWPGGGVVGVHGTDRPDLLPGRVSRGCIRLRNRDIARLRELLPLGTPIIIS
jgi:hypothetical protein